MHVRCVALFLALASLGAAQTAGLPNFHKVDDRVYRGAQPTPEGFRALSQLGIKTVLDLRGSEHSEAKEKQLVEAAGMRYISLPMRGMARPSDEQIATALKVLNDPASGPVFVHCRRGADRTGAVVACYRISHDHWDTARAMEEANSNGMSRFEIAIRHYISHYEATLPAATTQPTALPAN